MINDIKLLIIMRHGERTDRAGGTPKCGTMNPELTEKGKLQSFLASKLTIETIKNWTKKMSQVYMLISIKNARKGKEC